MKDTLFDPATITPRSPQELHAPAGYPPEFSGPLDDSESGTCIPARRDPRGHENFSRSPEEIQADAAYRARHMPEQIEAAIKTGTEAALAALGPRSPRRGRGGPQR